VDAVAFIPEDIGQQDARVRIIFNHQHHRPCADR
jgi:hypothetical protein